MPTLANTSAPLSAPVSAGGYWVGVRSEVIVGLKFRTDRLFTTLPLFSNVSPSHALSQIPSSASAYLEYENMESCKSNMCVNFEKERPTIPKRCEKSLLPDKTVSGTLLTMSTENFVDILSWVWLSNNVKMEPPCSWQWSIDLFSTNFANREEKTLWYLCGVNSAFSQNHLLLTSLQNSDAFLWRFFQRYH